MIKTPFHVREKTPRSHFYTYHFSTAFGDVYETNSLRLFAKEFGIKHESLSDLVSGRIRTYKGFRFVSKNSQDFRMVDPDGVEHKVDHIKRFSEKHNLNVVSLYQIYRGAKHSIKGWHPSIIPSSQETEGYVKQIA